MLVIEHETDTVTMSQAEYEALAEVAEDAEDLAHLAGQEERERVLGIETARRDYLPRGLVARMPEGERSPRRWTSAPTIWCRETRTTPDEFIDPSGTGVTDVFRNPVTRVGGSNGAKD